jgi:hypothetical protein
MEILPGSGQSSIISVMAVPSFNFDGVDDYINQEIFKHTNRGTALTIEAWMQIHGKPNVWEGGIVTMEGTSGVYPMRKQQWVNFAWGTKTTINELITINLVTGRWYHLAGV